jgi:hypothetical protein
MHDQPDKCHLDDLLDEALAGTFPASDPVSGLVADEKDPVSGGAHPGGRPAGEKGEYEADQ